MTRDEIIEDIWGGLPLLRRNLLGKKRIRRFIEAAVAESPIDVLQHVNDRSHQAEIVAATWKGAIKKRYCVEYGDDSVQFGPLFWIIAIPIIQYIVKKLMERWFGGREDRDAIAAWRKEMAR